MGTACNDQPVIMSHLAMELICISVGKLKDFTCHKGRHQHNLLDLHHWNQIGK